MAKAATVCTGQACGTQNQQPRARKSKQPKPKSVTVLTKPHTLECPIASAKAGVQCVALGVHDYAHEATVTGTLYHRQSGTAWDVNAIPVRLHVLVEGCSTSASCYYVQFGFSPLPTPNMPVGLEDGLYTPFVPGKTDEDIRANALKDWHLVCTKSPTLTLCGQSRWTVNLGNDVLRKPLRELSHLLFIRWCSLGGVGSFTSSVTFQLELEGGGVCHV